MRLIKLAGYGAWFFIAFLVGVVVTFPMEGLKSTAINFAEEKLGRGAQGKHGVDPSVQVGALSLSLASFGVKAKNVRVQLASDNPEPGPVVELDAVTVGLRPWTLLSDAKTVSVAARGYGGSVDGTVKFDVKKNELKSADVEIDDVDLGRMTILMEKIGVPIGGKLSLDADLDLGENAEKDAKGKIKLDGDKLSIGPGTMKLGPMKFEVKLEQGPVDLGKLSGVIDVEQGKGLMKDIKLAGNDVNVELFGEVFLKSRIQNSRLDADGSFLLTPGLLEREKALQSAIELGEKFGGMGGVSLPKAKDDEGRYYFMLKGSLGSPFPNLANDNGRKAKARKEKGDLGSSAGQSDKPERPKRERPPPTPRPPPSPVPTVPPVEATPPPEPLPDKPPEEPKAPEGKPEEGETETKTEEAPSD